MLRPLINDMVQRVLTLNKLQQRAQLQNFLNGLVLAEECRVLDFGCGTGLFASMFKRLGVNYTGYDIDPRLLQYAGRLYPQAVFTSSKDDLATISPYDLVLINCCAHHIPDDNLDLELLFLKGLMASAGICLLVDILYVPPEQDTFFHRQFMKFEHGQHVRSKDGYQRHMNKHFTIIHQTQWRSHFFSLPWRYNPLYNDLVVLTGRLMREPEI